MIELENGRAYDANHLALTSKQVQGEADGETGTVSMLSFVSSGEQHSVPASEVKGVRFTKSGGQSCSECHASLWNEVGAGIHINPPPMESTQ